uniref:Putative secreted protein n=1 Tax=Panstrongylus lignarius TaxID=156445 RepID=A0A224XTU0_9HEMI
MTTSLVAIHFFIFLINSVGSSLDTPISCPVNPFSFSRESSVVLLLSRIKPSLSGWSGSNNSLPVDSTATNGNL